MPVQDDKRAKVLDKVRKLLAKANDAGVTPEESQTFREAADRLMIAYTIEEWQVTADEPTNRPKPEVRIFDMSWWSSRNPFYHNQWMLMNSTAKHCRCVCIFWEWTHGQMKVAGLPSDLDYFDLLFTQLMLEMAKRMQPTPDANGEVGHEVFKLRQAGLPWPKITELIYKAKLVRLTSSEVERWQRYAPMDMRDEWDPAYETLRRYAPSVLQAVKNRLANANRRYVRDNGLQADRNYINPRVYQRSFAEGFVREIGSRMRRMRQEPEGDGSSMALVLQDIRQMVIRWVDENHPQPEPEEDDGKKSTAVSREPVFSWAAYNAGKQEAATVNINASPNKGLGNRRQIER